MKVCYLKSSHRINGASALRGRDVVAQLRAERDVHLDVSYMVLDGADGSDPDVLSCDQFLSSGYDAVVVESGLVDLGGLVRVPILVAESYVEGGGVLIVMDVDLNQAQHGLTVYRDQARRLFGAVPDSRGQLDTSLVYGSDETHFHMHPPVVICQVSEMAVDERLRGGLAGIDQILTSWPIQLRYGTAEIIASGNSTSFTLESDVVVDRPYKFPWASANLFGEGYSLLLGGGVSHHRWTAANPDNARWIVQLTRFFVDEVIRERELIGRNPLIQSTSFADLDDNLDRRVATHLELSEQERADIIKWSAARQDSLERRLRDLIVKVLTERHGSDVALEKVRAALPTELREQVASMGDIHAVLEKTYWMDLQRIITREWTHFARRFESNKRRFAQDMESMNLRLHAHAKTWSKADVIRVYESCRRLVHQCEPDD